MCDVPPAMVPPTHHRTMDSVFTWLRTMEPCRHAQPKTLKRDAEWFAPALGTIDVRLVEPIQRHDESDGLGPGRHVWSFHSRTEG